ncbi:MAG: TonB family protein [Acidobacteriota bacterium]
MAARNKPYEQFGPYLLFKKLEQDSLGDLWRAGRIENGQVGSTLALRRLSGGNRATLTAATEAVAQLLPRLTGPSFARDQIAGVADGVPFLAWDYAGGRSLRFIIDRARGGKDHSPNPLPLDQAIVIAEKVALSLATTGDLRDTAGTRLSHGALLPQFIWISDDGEIRVAAQQIAAGLVPALADPKVNAEIGRYFAPELRTSGQAPKSADVYSLGAILFLLVTGQEPPDAMTASAFVAAVRATKTMTGAPVPDDIRVVLDKSFNLDPSMRYASVTDMKQALSALAHGGKYSASTFNLAFYLSNLLKKEMETETVERDKESKLNLAPYLEAPRPAAVPVPLPAAREAAIAVPTFGASDEPKRKSKLPIAIAAALVLAVVGGGAWIMAGRKSSPPATATSTNAQMIPTATPAPKPVLPEPIMVSGGATGTAPAATSSADPAAQKRAFEDAVRLKLQSEVAKLNEQYMAELQRQQSKNAPVAAATPAVVSSPADDRPSVSASQLDQQRRDAAREDVPETRVPAPAPIQQTQTSAPAPVPQPIAPAPAPAPVATVREGDVVLYTALDSAPRAVRPINPIYPPLARQQRVAGTVLLSALINENGAVSDVKILRGINRLGIDDAAVRAMKSARFTSPMKDGKRVKTWWPQTIQFQP